jgi:hypothetical protein
MQIRSTGFDGEEAREFNWLALVADQIKIPVTNRLRIENKLLADFN